MKDGNVLSQVQLGWRKCLHASTELTLSIVEGLGMKAFSLRSSKCLQLLY